MNLELIKNMNLEELAEQKESYYFEKKSSKVSAQKLSHEICAFANATGGCILVGIDDNSSSISGFKNNNYKEEITNLQSQIISYFKDNPYYNVKEFVYNDDILLLFEIYPSNKIIKMTDDTVYLRYGDKTQKLTFDEIKILEYNKGERNFEIDLVSYDENIQINDEVVSEYQKELGTNIPNKDFLEKKGFIRFQNNVSKFTNAGMLLFGKDIDVYFPNAKLRFIRYQGSKKETGERLNIIKEVNFSGNLIDIIRNSTNFIKSQLRDFQYLDSSGKFVSIPEYPYDAWLEGIVNAVVHRDYSNMGNHILVTIFDDRMEIQSPGKLPAFVTLENMKNTRYSRNPLIARYFYEMKIIKEMNEGVNRIYEEMKRWFLAPPMYSEPNNNSVKLILENNIGTRQMRNMEDVLKKEYVSKNWENFSKIERKILIALSHGAMSSTKLSELTQRSKTTINKILTTLIDLEIVDITTDSRHDPTSEYVLK